MRISNLLSAIGSGILFGAGFLVPKLWPLVFFGIVPLLYIGAKRRITGHAAFLYGWITGLILHLCALAAIFWGTLPIDWFGVHSTTLQIVLVAVSWIVAAAVLAAGTGIFLFLANPILQQKRYLIFGIPILWAATEWAGAIFFSIISIGPGSLIGAHFSLGHIGYVLANDIALAQAAWLGGVYLLSALVIAGGIIFYRIAFDASRRMRIAHAALLLIACTGIYTGHFMLSRPALVSLGTGITIAVVSSDAPPRLYLSQEEERERADRLADVLKSIPNTTHAILLPEGATYGRFNSLSETPFPLIIDSENIGDAAGSHSHAAFHYSDGSVVRSSKQFVLPIGEYLPYMFRAGLRLFASAEFADQVFMTRSFVRGTETQFAETGGARIAVRFCDEVMSPSLYADDAKRDASILGNISSYSWFHGSQAVWSEMQIIARVRAIESRRTYVQSGNTAPAYVLDSYGRLIAETPFNTYEAVVARVSPSESKTPYIFIMHMLPLLFALTIIAGVWHVFVRKDFRQDSEPGILLA